MKSFFALHPKFPLHSFVFWVSGYSLISIYNFVSFNSFILTYNSNMNSIAPKFFCLGVFFCPNFPLHYFKHWVLGIFLTSMCSFVSVNLLILTFNSNIVCFGLIFSMNCPLHSFVLWVLGTFLTSIYTIVSFTLFILIYKSNISRSSIAPKFFSLGVFFCALFIIFTNWV